MVANTQKIDLVIQYALLVAGEEDDYFDQQLGPIHLIKYVYLADLFYASRNKGETFTGVDWQFYNFGPWSQAVHSRVNPALKTIMANKQTFESDYGESDWERWNLRDKYLLNDKRQLLPPTISSQLQRDIHKYLKDLPSLLDHVYRTEPMLNAAPGETINFSFACEKSNTVDATSGDLKMQTISKKKQKIFKNKMSVLRKEFQKGKDAESKLYTPVENPRHDEIYFQGIQWLEESTGEAFSNKSITANFSSTVWKSKTRKGEDVS